VFVRAKKCEVRVVSFCFCLTTTTGDDDIDRPRRAKKFFCPIVSRSLTFSLSFSLFFWFCLFVCSSFRRRRRRRVCAALCTKKNARARPNKQETERERETERETERDEERDGERERDLKGSLKREGGVARALEEEEDMKADKLEKKENVAASPPPKGGKNATTSITPAGTLRGYWQAEEETALRAAVQKHGIGAWEKMRTDPDFKALRCVLFQSYIFFNRCLRAGIERDGRKTRNSRRLSGGSRRLRFFLSAFSLLFFFQKGGGVAFFLVAFCLCFLGFSLNRKREKRTNLHEYSD